MTNSFAKKTLLITLLGCLIWSAATFSHDSEPLYKEKPFHYWIAGLYLPGTNSPTFAEARDAVLASGTNAVPILLQMLRRRDFPWKTDLMAIAQKQSFIHIKFTPAYILHIQAANGLALLGNDAEIAIPDLIKIYNQNLSSSSRKEISYLFFQFGKKADAAVPSLVKGLTSSDPDLRNMAISALGKIRTHADIVVPALIIVLQDSFAPNRQDAAYALGQYGESAEAAIVPLNELLKNPALTNNTSGQFANISEAARFAIEHITAKISNDKLAK